MGTGFGIDGTSSEDIQSITNALYTPGIISGAKVNTKTTLAYAVTAGVACVEMASGLSILIPIPAVSSIPTATAPATGTRIDKVYAVQETVATGGTEPQVQVDVTSGALPDNSLELSRYSIPAGATNTNAATRVGGIDYSIPYGTSGHSLWYHHNTHNGPLTTTPNSVNGSFYLPTDRAVDIEISATFDIINGADASVYFEVDIDGVREVTMGTGKLTSWYTTYFLKHTAAIPAGQHTVRINIEGSGQGADIMIRHGGSTKRPGASYKLRDAGVMV